VHWDEGGKSSHHEELAARPKLSDLYKAIKDGQVKHLFIYDQSRLSRNDQVASIFRYECNKQGVTLYTKDGKFDLSNPQDKFLKQILDGLSEFENSIRAERTRLGKLNRARTGGWHGGPPPFGYKIVSKRLVAEPTEARWVAKIFTEAHRGRSPQKIREILESNDVSPRRGGMWSLGSVAALLKNTHYIGRYTFKDKKTEEEIIVQCPAIVDSDLWTAVQLKRSKRTSRIQQQNATTRWFYLLRDLMYCAHCGRPIAGRQRPTKRERFYYCPNKERDWVKKGAFPTKWKRGTGCGMSRSLNIPETDELVFETVRTTHKSSSLLREEVKRRVLATTVEQSTKTPKQLVVIRARIRRLDTQIDQAETLLGSISGKYDLGELPKRAYTARAQIIKEKIEALQTEANNARLELKGDEKQLKWVDWYKSFGDQVDALANLTDEQKRDYISGLVERIDVTYDATSNEHQLKLRFHLPIVGDGLRWKSRSKRKLGYDLLEGARQLHLRLAPQEPLKRGKPPAP
jgi:DNA invertase Pin-like site-specific DNA recombinase